MNFKDRIVLITGAGSGLGRQLALDLEKSGCRIAMGDLNEEGLLETAALLKTPEDDLFLLKADVTNTEDCRRLVEGTIEKFGQLDICIPCAGTSMWADFLDIKDLSLFRKMIDINYLAVVDLLHFALPHLLKTRGSLVTISSFQAVFGIAHHTAYSASKHALNGFLAALESELGDSIHILNVMPAWISGTNLRNNAYQASGDQGGKIRKHSRRIATVTVEDCSHQIVKAIAKGKRELFQPKKAGHLRWINTLFPWFVSAFISHHVKKQHKEK